MKKAIIITSLFFSLSLVSSSQPVALDSLNKYIAGYWRLIGEVNPSGFEESKKNIVLVINSDKSIQYYENRRKTDWFTYRIDTTQRTLFKLETSSYLGGYIMEANQINLQFGYSAVDAIDFYFERMSHRQIEYFLGKKELSSAFRWKSKKKIMQFFADWQKMEPSIKIEDPKQALNIYQKEAYKFFSDFHTKAFKEIKEKRFVIVDVSLKNVQSSDFHYPNQAELDSYFEKQTGKKNYRALINDDKKYNLIMDENTNFWKDHFGELALSKLKFETYPLTNFMPYFQSDSNIIFLPLHQERKALIDKYIRRGDRKYHNWDFMKRHLGFPMGGVQYDYTETVEITGLVFNKSLDLAIVDYQYPYTWKRVVYEKVKGTWVFRKTIQVTKS